MFNSYAIDHIIGDSVWAQRIRKRILRVAAYEYNVLVTGPSGTGKELIARAVHAHSSRSDKPFIPVDCATIPSGLFSSQLFGHVKGAFTGADQAALGCFRAADGGTIFLDEIGELDLDHQTKLLRVLQERQVVAVGSHAPLPVNVRVVAATHRDLRKEVRAGRFRLDLFYRLNVVRMEAEPLAGRTDDIPVLAEHFLAKAAMENGLPLKRISHGALAKLASHDWPGNVRELEHAIERAMVFHEGSLLDAEAFADLAAEGVSPEGPAVRDSFANALPSTPEADGYDAPTAATPFTPAADSSAVAMTEAPSAVMTETQPAAETYDWPTLAELEEVHIRKTLKETFYNQSAAARLLGIDRKQLARRIKKFDIRIPRLQPGRPS